MSRCAAHWRPFLAPSLVRRARAVRLKLGQCTIDAVVARPIRPCYAECSPYVRRPSGALDSACRRSYVPVRTPRSVTCTLPCPYCRVSQFLAASFARNRRVPDFLKFGTFGGCASGERVGECSESSEYSLPLTFTQNENAVDPRGLRAVLCSGTGWVLVYPYSPSPRPRRAQR